MHRGGRGSSHASRRTVKVGVAVLGAVDAVLTARLLAVAVHDAMCWRGGHGVRTGGKRHGRHTGEPGSVPATQQRGRTVTVMRRRLARDGGHNEQGAAERQEQEAGGHGGRRETRDTRATRDEQRLVNPPPSSPSSRYHTNATPTPRALLCFDASTQRDWDLFLFIFLELTKKCAQEPLTSCRPSCPSRWTPRRGAPKA